MPFGVALFPDPESERAVRALWQRLADEGGSQTTLDAGVGPSSPARRPSTGLRSSRSRP